MTAADRLTTALAERYRLERQLGQGGMATVYLAEDVKHDRKVAVKVLRPELAAVLGGDRFVQEIKTTAQLQHPHILPLFDSGEADGFLFYVMPYVEGETLRDKLDRETQLGIDEAVRITREIADALDYAHRQGVIHRDIKPENILLHDGRPVVADFGIALALSAAAGGRMTETGMSLGTPHYMSPEQATADKDITARSDVYSLASVLYEMLTGNPPHTGSSAQQIIMRIVAEEVAPVTTLRKSVPPNVTAAVAKALEKVPADRFASARAFADALVDPGFSVVTRATPGRPALPPYRLTATRSLATVAILALALAAWGWLRPAPTPIVTRFDITPRSGGVADAAGQLALSPDGSRLAYVGTGPDGTSQLMTRAFTALDPEPVPGTEGAVMPAVSPDGETIAFMRDGMVVTMPIAGGPALTIGEGSDPAWADDGTIYFARDQVIWRVDARGGSAERVTTEVDGVQVMPQPLPGGRGLLLTVRRSVASFSRIAVVGPDGGAPREILDGTMARYAASGHLVYATADGTLLAAPFDLGRLEPGAPVPLIANVAVQGASHTLFALADNGTLVYRMATAARQRELVWVDRTGRAAFIDSSLVGVSGFGNLAPDGATVAISSGDDVLVKRLDATPGVRLAFDEQVAHPTWTPDGDSITVHVGSALVTRRADGSGQTVQTVTDPREPVAPAWAPDQSWLVYRTNINMAGQGDILAIRPGVDSAPTPIVATPATELSPALSPDGRWLAYSSDESGDDEIYVVPFPNSGDGRWVVSRGGGTTPRWSPRGDELFYVGQDSLMAVTFTAAPTFAVRSSRALFSMQGYGSGGLHPAWAVAPDGRHFLMSRAVEQPTSRQEPRLILVQHFFQELRDKVGR